MKKLIILIAAVACINVSLRAQDMRTDYREKVLFGLKAGFNYSNVYDEQGQRFDADPKFGLAAGAFIAIPIGRFAGLQPEVLISQKGFQGNGEILGGTYELKRTTTYIDFPLLVAFKPSSFLTLVAGPQYSYLIHQKDAFTNGTSSMEQEREFENDNIRRNILGFTAGADINVRHMVISGRAGWDVLSNRGDGTSETPRYKNVWYQATLGYRFFDN